MKIFFFIVTVHRLSHSSSCLLHCRKDNISNDCDNREGKDKRIVDVLKRYLDGREKIQSHFPVFIRETVICLQLFNELIVLDSMLSFLGDQITIEKEEEISYGADVPYRPYPGRLKVLKNDDPPEGNCGDKTKDKEKVDNVLGGSLGLMSFHRMYYNTS